MNEAQIIQLRGKRIFTYADACQLLPIVRRITNDAVEKAEKVMIQMDVLDKLGEKHKALELVLNSLIEEWVNKIERLGCEAKGMWLVDFDSGNGYYCWQHGESRLGHFHGYAEGFGGRRPIEIPSLTIH